MVFPIIKILTYFLEILINLLILVKRKCEKIHYLFKLIILWNFI